MYRALPYASPDVAPKESRRHEPRATMRDCALPSRKTAAKSGYSTSDPGQSEAINGLLNPVEAGRRIRDNRL
jgi:hypothetical protein